MPSLSIEKLQYFAQNNGFRLGKIFTHNDQCCMVELISIHTINNILLNIPEKYKFQLPPDVRVYAIHRTNNTHQPTKNDEIDGYVHVSESVLSNTYSNMESMSVSSSSKLPMSEHLNETYKTNVIIDDIKGKRKVSQSDMCRQLERLKYCIKGMTHKLALIDSPYIVMLNHEDQVEVYECNTLPKEQQKMVVVVQFKMFYDRIESIDEECDQILQGVYKVLDHNQNSHTKNIKTMLQKKQNIIECSEELSKQKQEYHKYIHQYIDLLDELYSHEKNKHHDLMQLSEHVNSKTDLRYDMKRTHQKQKIEKEIKKMDKTRTELVKTIEEIKNQHQHLTLTIDTILFDNIVLLDKIFKNFEKLETLKKN